MRRVTVRVVPAGQSLGGWVASRARWSRQSRTATATFPSSKFTAHKEATAPSPIGTLPSERRLSESSPTPPAIRADIATMCVRLAASTANEITAMFGGLPLPALNSLGPSRLHAKANEPCDVLGCLVQGRTIGPLVRIKNWLSRPANSVSNSVT